MKKIPVNKERGVVIYVWLPQRGGNKSYFGHVSMHVGSNYISWWPEDFNWSFSSPATMFKSYSVHRVPTLQNEIVKERREPDFSCVLHQIDCSAILEWWKGFGLNSTDDSGNTLLYSGPLPRYSLFKQSCSGVIAMALQAGLHDKRYFSRIKNLTPVDIMKFVIKLKKKETQTSDSGF